MTSSILACAKSKMAMTFMDRETSRRRNQEFSFSISLIMLPLLIYVTLMPLDDEPPRYELQIPQSPST